MKREKYLIGCKIDYSLHWMIVGLKANTQKGYYPFLEMLRKQTKKLDNRHVSTNVQIVHD